MYLDNTLDDYNKILDDYNMSYSNYDILFSFNLDLHVNERAAIHDIIVYK